MAAKYSAALPISCGSPRPFEQGLADDFGLHRGIDIGWPHDRTGCDAIHAHLGRQFTCQCFREHDQGRLRAAVRRVVLQGPEAVDVDHVQDQSAPPPQLRGCGLGEEQRCAQIRADEILELAGGDCTDRRRIECRAALLIRISSRPKCSTAASTSAGRRVTSSRSACTVMAEAARAALSASLRRACLLPGGPMMDHDIRAGRVQCARHRGAEPAGTAGNQYRPVRRGVDPIGPYTRIMTGSACQCCPC